MIHTHATCFKHRGETVLTVIKHVELSNHMGRIKTKMVKSVTHDLFEYYEDEFTTEFDDNKEVVETYLDGASKTLRNTIAGYATRLKKRKEDQART